MSVNAYLADPWRRIIGCLSAPSDVAAIEGGTRRRPGRPFPLPSDAGTQCTPRTPADSNPFVRLLDRLTSTTIAVEWHDPAHGCYREQIWVACYANHAGRCALTGNPISVGESIYRPRCGRSTPINVSVMIRASVVDERMPCWH